MPVLLVELVMDEAKESDTWHGVLVEDFTRIKNALKSSFIRLINSGLNLGANVSCQDVSGEGRAGVTDADAAGAFNLTLASGQQTRNLAC